MARVSADTRFEISRLLRLRDDFIGRVYDLWDDGESDEDIAAEMGHKNTGSTRNFITAIEYLLGDLRADPSKKQAMDQAKYRVKEWLKLFENGDLPLSNEAADHFNSILNTKKASELATESLLEKFSDTPVDREHERHAKDPLGSTGIYVYSYPQYLRAETVSPDSRTLFKVGASGDDLRSRIEFQRKNTEVPEDLIIVRIYPVRTSQVFVMEEKFHKLLTAAGHHHVSKTGGTEWFNTSMELLDVIADALDLDILQNPVGDKP